jgi:hypothetical protein
MAAAYSGCCLFDQLVGEIEFSGELTPFHPFLLVGQELHVCKNTSFSLVKYVIKSW